MWKPEHRLTARRVGQRYDSDLTDEEWALVAPRLGKNFDDVHESPRVRFVA
jgi:hypothetical protein